MLEDFVSLEDKEDESRYKEAVLRNEFDQNLGAYPLERYSQWSEVSSYIS